jgi:microcystin-dependent protein
MANAVDQTVPQNKESPTLGAQRIRETRSGFNNLLTVEHDISDSATTKGFHGTNVTGKVDTSISTPPSGYGRFGWKTIGGVAELFYRDDAGNEVQITNVGQIKSPPSGSIVAYGGSSAPSGWLLCNGAAVSQTTYAALFAVIGTAYDNSPGAGNFNVPDLRGRVPVGLDSGNVNNSVADALGETGGSEFLQAHTHEVNRTQTAAAGAAQFVCSEVVGNSITTDSTGAGSGQNMQPYNTVNYIIKT